MSDGIDYLRLFEATPTPYLILSPDLRIVAVNDAYTKATMTRREDLMGSDMFDAFPDNPIDPDATGVRNLKASFEAVLQRRQPDVMAIQKYDIRRPRSAGGASRSAIGAPSIRRSTILNTG